METNYLQFFSGNFCGHLVDTLRLDEPVSKFYKIVPAVDEKFIVLRDRTAIGSDFTIGIICSEIQVHFSFEIR